MTRTAIGFAVAWSLMIGTMLLPAPATDRAYAGQEDWKAEFADICSKTENPMALTADEIKGLIDRCDKLKPRIEKLDESAAKVYLKRLKMCRDLFVFVLESKSK